VGGGLVNEHEVDGILAELGRFADDERTLLGAREGGGRVPSLLVDRTAAVLQSAVMSAFSDPQDPRFDRS